MRRSVALTGVPETSPQTGYTVGLRPLPPSTLPDINTALFVSLDFSEIRAAFLKQLNLDLVCLFQNYLLKRRFALHDCLHIKLCITCTYILTYFIKKGIRSGKEDITYETRSTISLISDLGN